MFGISIDDRPGAPVGSPATRRTVAIHWDWTSEYTREEMAAALGVTKQTIDGYLDSKPSREVREKMDGVEATVRIAAVAELKDQLRRVGSRSKTEEKPVKIYENGEGEVEVWDGETDAGERVIKGPKVQDIQLLPDEEARYYARGEVRDIIDLMTDIVGAKEPDKQEVEHSGQIDGERTLGEEEQAAIREGLSARRKS